MNANEETRRLALQVAALQAQISTLPTWEQVEDAYTEGWNTNHRDPCHGNPPTLEEDWRDSNARAEIDEVAQPDPTQPSLGHRHAQRQ